jgi:pimeloyl-ACP methyl ester carboxylesterase
MKLILLLLFLISNSIFALDINKYEIPIQIDDYNLINKIDEDLKLPYPILFIHGLNSSSKAWQEMNDFLTKEQKLKYGGTFHFCLNYDGNNSIANKKLYPETNADIGLFKSDRSAGDFYLMNFNIDRNGIIDEENPSFNDVLSNESAISKQAVALKYAIQNILQMTGKKKVILFGHSMGGLASREYIQNNEYWLEYGEHSVAKLITTGTPHGGYQGVNSSIITGINERSEAYRDLRHSFYISEEKGVYLYGGQENSKIMNQNLLQDFYNFDVNCNGIINEKIIGLNQRQLPNNLDYSYIVGICNGCPVSNIGDGVVRQENANLNNFYDLGDQRNEFIIQKTAISQIHTELPNLTDINLRALDEPSILGLAYNLESNNNYLGYIQEQALIKKQDYDLDSYLISEPSNFMKFTIQNSLQDTLFAYIFNKEQKIVKSEYLLAAKNMFLFDNIKNEEVHLVLMSKTNSNSYKTPYTIKYENLLSIKDKNENNNIINIYPLPSTDFIYIDVIGSYNYNVNIYDVLGNKVEEIENYKNNEKINLASLKNGIYSIIIQNNNLIYTEKIIINK